MDHTGSSGFRRSTDEAAHYASFEETYQRHEFAELVRLALAVGAWLANMRRRVQRPRLEVSGDRLSGGMNPAE